MAYYWITEAQKYIQSLGFGTTRRGVNKESQDIRINQLGIDNSYSWDKHDVVRFGKGGVDDAEDAEVILHEYGHAIQDSQQDPFGFGPTVESGSIGEGFADYWAVTVGGRRLADARSCVRRRLGLGLVHLDDAALPPAGRPQPPLPRRTWTDGAPRRPDLVAGAVGHP